MPVPITLNGVSLNGDMRYIERSKQQSVSMSAKRTLLGGVVVYSGQLLAGLPFTLEAGDDYGWLTAAMRDYLMAQSALPGQIHTLAYNGVTYLVIFDHTGGPAVDLEPVELFTEDDEQNAFIGQLHFITV